MSTATRKTNFEKIEAHVAQACRGNSDPALHRHLHELLNRVGSEAEAMMVLEGDVVVAERHGIPPGNDREMIYVERRNRVNRLLDKVVTAKERRQSFSSRLGRWAISPWLGLPILAVTLYLIYAFVGVFVAGDVVNFTEGTVGNRYFEVWVKDRGTWKCAGVQITPIQQRQP